MMTETTPPCPLGVTGAMLSAWRDDLLEEAEAERLRQHVHTCRACQQQQQDFERIAALLRRQRELDPGARIWQGVQARIARPRRRWSVRPLVRSSFLSGLAAALTVLVLVVLFARLLGSRLTTTGPVAMRTASPAPTSATPAAGFTVADPALARQISFAYVTNGTLWISHQGTPPQPVAHLDMPGPTRSWGLSWTPDQTKLLVAGAGTSADRAWILSLPANRLTPLPAADSVVAKVCGVLSCIWIGDRYLLYPTKVENTTHAVTYQFYDTQAQRTVPTPLDDQPVSEVEVRGAQVYFTPYVLPTGPGATGPAVINRFDLESLQITTVFTLPGQPITQQGLLGSWDLSSDAQQVVASLCLTDGCHNFYQEMSGPVVPIFPGYYARATIAPDGKYAAGLVITSSIPAQGTSYELVQQTVPAGSAVPSPLPANSPGQDEQVFGWSGQPLGVFLQQAPTDASAMSQTNLWFAPVGTRGEAVLVETIAQAQVAVAPIDTLTHAGSIS